MEAIEAGDEDAFLDKLQGYDSMSKLDKWKTAMFLKIKEGIDAEPDLTWRTVYITYRFGYHVEQREWIGYLNYYRLLCFSKKETTPLWRGF